MSSTIELDQVAVQEQQRVQAKRATADLFKNGKKPRRASFEFVLNEGEDPISVLMVALPSKKYDKLVLEHGPTQRQQREGMNINPDTFCPALLARVVREPELSEEDWLEIWSSEEWSRGELNSLYGTANELCNRHLDLTPFDIG